MTLEEQLKEEQKKFDPYYQYSDDPQVWHEQNDRRKLIEYLTKELEAQRT